MAVVQNVMKRLRESLIKFDVKNLFNMDETNHFFTLLPKKSYIMQAKNRCVVCETKAMKAKGGITAYVCTNPICKRLFMAIIVKAEESRVL